MTPTQHTLNIAITVDVPSGTTGALTEEQVMFQVDQPTIQLPSPANGGRPVHVINFMVSGKFNDGSLIDPQYCRLLAGNGIYWYDSTLEEHENPALDQGQRTALEQWLRTNSATIAPDGRSATLSINRASMTGILNPGQTLRLMWGINLQVARNAPSPWLTVAHDPEVDIEMDA